MYRIIVILAMLVYALFPAKGQTNLDRAKELLTFSIAGQGDSISVRMNEGFRTKIAPQVIGDAFRGLERQFGKYQSHGEWYTDSIRDFVIYCSDIQFEHYALKFFASFDEDGLANTLRFVPLPAKSNVEEVKLNTDKVIETEIVIDGGKYKLPGTLSLPRNVTKPPVVILVHGSGGHDRDETIGQNKPFRDLAWGLSNLGVAVVRYDKRSYVHRTPEAVVDYDDDTVDDALAAIELVKKNPDVDSNRIYLVGHSQGAWLAPRIAERSDDALAGIILIAGPARPLEDLMVEQVVYITSLTDSTDKAKEQTDQLKAQAANVKAIGTDKYDETVGLPLGTPLALWEYSNKYNAVECAKKLKLPILILQGERDYQVTMQDFGLWRFGLYRNSNVSFKSYPKLNHLLQEGSGKSTPFEYNQKVAVPPYLIQDIVDFLSL